MCPVFLPAEERVVNILGEHLEPVTPAQFDRVKVSNYFSLYSCVATQMSLMPYVLG